MIITYDREFVRQYVSKSRVYSMKIGDTFSIDSGMGGSFTVEFRGLGCDPFGKPVEAHFHSVTPGWPLDWDIAINLVCKRIFIYTQELSK